MRSSLLHLSVWILICIVMIVGHGFWYSIIVNKNSTVASLQNQIDTKTETAKRVISERTALSEISSYESVVQNYFVPETRVVSFIDELETRARAQSAVMKVLSVSVGDAKKRPTLVFSVTVSGAFDALMRTLGVIEYAPYDISISKLSIVKDGRNDWHANMELIVGSMPSSPTTKKPI